MGGVVVRGWGRALRDGDAGGVTCIGAVSFSGRCPVGRANTPRRCQGHARGGRYRVGQALQGRGEGARALVLPASWIVVVLDRPMLPRGCQGQCALVTKGTPRGEGAPCCLAPDSAKGLAHARTSLVCLLNRRSGPPSSPPRRSGPPPPRRSSFHGTREHTSHPMSRRILLPPAGGAAGQAAPASTPPTQAVGRRGAVLHQRDYGRAQG